MRLWERPVYPKLPSVTQGLPGLFTSLPRVLGLPLSALALSKFHQSSWLSTILLNINNFVHYPQVSPWSLQVYQVSLGSPQVSLGPESPQVYMWSLRITQGFPMFSLGFYRLSLSLIRVFQISPGSPQGLPRVSLESPQNFLRVFLGLHHPLLWLLFTILLNINNFIHHSQVSPGSS